MATQHFYLRERYLGSREIPTYHERDGIGFGVAASYLLICDKCHNTWARIIHDHFASYTNVRHRACPEHAEAPDDGFLSSSFHRFEDENLYLAADWPLAAIRHDFDFAIAQAEGALTKEPA